MSRPQAGLIGLALGLVLLATWLTDVVAQQAQSTGHPVTSSSTAPLPTTPTAPAAHPEPDPEADVLLVWGHGGTDDGFSEAVRDLPGVLQVSAVRVDRRDIIDARTASGEPVVDLPAGWVYPLDTAAIDPTDHQAVLGAAASPLGALEVGRALLSETSARLRGLDVGSLVALADGTEREIVGVVDDRIAGYAELVVHPQDSTAIGIERYLLVRHDGDADAVTNAIQGVAVEQLRIVEMPDTMYPRHGDGVLPQLVIKEHFGEFAMLDIPGRQVQVGASWRAAQLAARTLPRVGFTLCHQIVMDAFARVLDDLADQGLLDALDPNRYQGCFLGRVIGASRTLSHHSWGLAVDVNVNPADVFTADLPAAVVETFERHGFVWGGDFLRPDEPHFEYVGDLLERT